MTLLHVLAPDLEVLLRLGAAVVCSVAIGYNRAHHYREPHLNKPHLRLHVLVGLSACLMVLAAGSDPNAYSRAIQGVATGVGFLGAGQILQDRRTDDGGRDEVFVHGLTSAAAVWLTAALSVTVATSSAGLAIIALVLALGILSLDRSRR